MEDSMINMPDLVFDEKIGNKRVRDDDEDEIHKGRLEKRPSGILGDGRDYSTGDDEGGGGDSAGGGGIIDTFISNVFQKNKSGTTDGEAEAGHVFDHVVEDEDKPEDLGVDGGQGGGAGIISSFFSNIFHHNGSADDDGHQLKSDHLDGGPGGEDGGEPEDVINAEKLSEKKDIEAADLPGKDSKGDASKMKPDDYAESFS
ncbi:hypothetical protein R6Q57_017272 [Mikania cordata]